MMVTRNHLRQLLRNPQKADNKEEGGPVEDLPLIPCMGCSEENGQRKLADFLASYQAATQSRTGASG